MAPIPITTGVEVAGTVAREAFAELAPIQPDRPESVIERRYTNAASEFVRVDDARIHYRDEGPEDAPILLTLHGSYSSLHTWDPWVQRLGDRFRMLRLDMPGFGLTGPRSRRRHTLEAVVETVGEFCDELGVTDLTVAGNSLGGGVAWRLATDRPDLVSRLVLIDAGGASMISTIARSYRILRTDVVPRYVTPRILVRMVVRDAYGDPSKVTRELVTRYHDMVLRRGNRAALVELARNYRTDHMEDPGVFEVDAFTLPSMEAPVPNVHDEYDLSDVDVPTLFMWGEEDRWLPVSFARELAAQVDDYDFRTYEGVGHVPMEEVPNQTARDVAAFVEE